MTRAEEFRLRLFTVDFLRMVKQTMTYAALERLTGLPTSVLNRYVKGQVIPLKKRAEELLRVLRRSLGDVALDFVVVDEETGFIDVEGAVSNPFVRRMFCGWVVEKVTGGQVNAVLALNGDGAVLGAEISSVLNVPLIRAREKRRAGGAYYTGVVRRGWRSEEIYVQKSLLKKLRKKGVKKSAVIVVEGLIRTGATVSALCDIAEKAGFVVTGVFSLFGVKGWEKAPAIRALEEKGVPCYVAHLIWS